MTDYRRIFKIYSCCFTFNADLERCSHCRKGWDNNELFNHAFYFYFVSFL